MEVQAIVFIGAIIAGVTEAIRSLSPKVQGWVTVLVAVVVGVLIALLDKEIGVQNVSVAQGILIGLGTAGVAGTVKKIG